MNRIKIEMPGEFLFVRGVRVCIANIAHNFAFSDREIYHIETIVDELCNNAIEHGGKKSEKPEENIIRLDCVFDAGKLELAVTDKGGEGFDLAEMIESNRKLAEDAVNFNRRGRGLLIVYKFVDDLDVSTNSEGTTVRLLKRAKNN